MVLAPFPPRLDAMHGGSRAVAELVVRLSARHPVALLALRGPGEPAVDERLAAGCAQVRTIDRPDAAGQGLAGAARMGLSLIGGTPMWVSRWRVAAMAAAVQETAAQWRPDVVQLESHVMGQYLPALAGSRAPRVLRQLEPGVGAARDRLGRRTGPRRLLGRLDLHAWHAFERRVMADVQSVVALTEADAAALQPLAGRTPITRIPLGIAIPAHASDPAGAAGEILFVGNFVHPPNVDAAERLIHRIFPAVRARCPAAVLRIVGPNPPPHLAAAAPEGVTITGEVPEIAPYLERAAVVVAPLALGGGMRVKVAEALAAGKAVVASRIAAGGMAVSSGDQAILADDDAAFAVAVAELLGDPARRAALGLRGRAWAERHLGWDEPVGAFERLYATLLARDLGAPAPA